jgi:hypothetical protein
MRTYHILTSTRLGYRGAFLLFLAALDGVYGWFLVNPTSEQERTTQFQWRDHIMPTEAWGVIWLAAAAYRLDNPQWDAEADSGVIRILRAINGGPHYDTRQP